MRIELTHLSDRTFAGATHESVARELLASAGLEHDGEGAQLTFDARYLAVPPELVAQIAEHGGRLTDGNVVVLDTHTTEFAQELPGPWSITTDEPLGAGVAERAFVDRLLSELDGVTLHDPARIWIEAGVTVAPGATLWPNVVLKGSTKIGAAEIGVGVVLTDCTVGDGAHIKPYTVAEGATIGAAAVGPMAHLRTGAVLEDQVKVGNFVEVKKTVLRQGAKASHLTYLGDAEIGAGANIGAGTITCNYDGYNKWKTEIGAGAFIGSNTSLVAPIAIGDGAIIGAGSTLTKSVKSDALALTRADSREIPGMAARLRTKNQKIKESRKSDKN